MQPPESQPMAFLSDIHGNLAALDAVLAELDQRGVSTLFVAGDLLLGGPEPMGVWRRLQERHARCVRGLTDTALATLDPAVIQPTSPEETQKANAFYQTRRDVGDLILERLRRLPSQLRVPMVDGREVLLVHASPADPGIDLSHDLSDEEILCLIADDPADIVACGATHVPFQRVIDELHLVNVGSVGATPEGHTAHFTVVTPKLSGSEVLQNYVTYA